MIYHWIKLGSPCLAKVGGGGRGPQCGLPRRLADGPHGGRMGLHPADDPGAPAGGWQCEAGHMDWILTGEVVEAIAPPPPTLAEILAPAAMAGHASAELTGRGN